MGKTGQTYQRKNYFIKKEFQFKFILKFCLIMLAGITLSTCFVFIFSQDTLTSSFNDSRLVIENTGQAILPTILITNLITLAIITLAAIAVTLFISHKIAGPMFRFEKDIQSIATGDLGIKINLRQKDQFTTIATCLNEMTLNLNSKIQTITSEINDILDSKKEIKNVDDYSKRVLELKNRINELFTL